MWVDLDSVPAFLPCPACDGGVEEEEEEGMDEFELEDNLEFILQSIQELMEDQGDNNAFGDANQNELFASLVSYDQVCYPSSLPFRVFISFGDSCFVGDEILINPLLVVFLFFFSRNVVSLFVLQENMLPDVSAADVAAGKDMQGIPWEKMLFGRDKYREMKMKNYRNYQNLSYAREDALQVLNTCPFPIFSPNRCPPKF